MVGRKMDGRAGGSDERAAGRVLRDRALRPARLGLLLCALSLGSALPVWADAVDVAAPPALATRAADAGAGAPAVPPPATAGATGPATGPAGTHGPADAAAWSAAAGSATDADSAAPAGDSAAEPPSAGTAQAAHPGPAETVERVWTAALPARSSAPGDHFTSEELEPLLKALEQLGFDRRDISGVFYDARLRKLDRVVAFNALNPDSEGIYEQFTTPYAIHLAKRFERRHLRQLDAVEREYGVSKHVLTAILLVETQFGNAKLPYRVLEVFTTLAVEGHPEAVDRYYERIKARNPDVEKDWLASRLVAKAQFAFQELVAALSMFRDNLQWLYEVRGSYAGAIGMPQFLPSSYLRWAVDGDADGRIDLNHLDDALPSIANYLTAHGWSTDAPFRDKWRAVWEYNHSPNYVRTIFEIAFRLSTPHKRR